MKNIQKDIPSLLGFIATASLAVVSGGLINPTLTNIGAGLAANFLGGFTPSKIRKWFITEHPDKLNHSIKKLFVESINEALTNVNVLFAETNNTDQEKTTAQQLIKKLQKHLPNMLLNEKQINLEEPEIKHFLYEKNKEEVICNFIETQFAGFGVTEPFKSFLAQNLPPQIQLCFGEGLKNPANQDAWIAFQRMLMEEIRNDIKQIADTQQSIKEDLSDLKFTKSGFSEEQMDEIRKLVKILNDKKLVELKIKDGINQSLESIETKANQIIQITTETNMTVSQLKNVVEKMRSQNRWNQIIIFSLAGALLIAGLCIAYMLINQPFTATIQVYGWESKQHNPLEGNGTLVLTIGEKTEIAEINRQGEAIFKGILPKYNGKVVPIYITDTENELYYLTDSVIQIYKNKKSEIQVLLRGLERFEGVVIDENGKCIADATVIVAGIKDKTDERGYFNIAIPLEKQQRTQEIEILKEGHISYRNIAMPMTGDLCRIILPLTP